jgi:hypothetical protein
MRFRATINVDVIYVKDTPAAASESSKSDGVLRLA